ncbi:MAG: ATP synthase F1 subunit delta [Solirubrobacterales bacterium]
MESIARVYAESLFAVVREKGTLDTVREQLGQFVEALRENRDLELFFFSPYFSTKEKLEGLELTLSDVDPDLLNFLEMLIEKHRMPVVFRIERRFEELWKQENERIEVTVTSAFELDPAIAEQVGAEVERQTGKSVELTSRVDDSIVGGLVLQVGNMVLDASIRNSLEKLRQSIARAA